MTQIQFSHPDIQNLLLIDTRPNQVQWSYGLNTQNFPTWAGEVVQILSAYVDNLQISGDVSTVRDMERIYTWFLTYIQMASQGTHASDQTFNASSYNEEPVLMEYPHRGWSLYIKPLSLPTLTYGRDVIVPQWSMEAAVVEPDLEMSKISLQDAQVKLGNETSALTPFTQFLANADIGYNPENPFERPDVPDAAMKKYLSGIKPQVDANEQNLVDWYNNLVPQYTSGNLKHGLLAAAQGGMSPYSKDAKQYAVDTSQIVFSGGSGAGVGAAVSGTPTNAATTVQNRGAHRQGLDYAENRPVSEVKAHGASFVARYLSHTPAKNLSKGEAQGLHAAGIDIMVIWETSASRALDGHGAGVSDAQEAQSQANACGMPGNRPIYFAVDFDASGPDVEAYFDGVKSVLGVNRTGAYGGIKVMAHLFGTQRIAFGWQAFAWSAGQWDARAQVQQYQVGSIYDLDRSTAADFGQW